METENSKISVDAVITWVDGGDQNHKNKMAPFIKDKKRGNAVKFRTRFDQVEEIKFTVDSIIKFAPFINYIYIVTDNQVPSFLKSNSTKYQNVIIIDHKAIFKNKEVHLPVFNCRSIETQLYKIPNLSEHFIYFNDDMFLIKETKISDFFVDGLPILRGKWLKFNKDILYKRIFSKKLKSTKASHKKAQEKGAQIIGYKKYYKFEHTPDPLRKSTFIKYFKQNPEIEDLNCSFKFRSHLQFTPQGLANHLEIENKTSFLKKDCQLTYIQNYKKPFFWLKFKLKLTEHNKNKLFLNMQGLNQCPKEKLDFVLTWLEKTTS